MYNKTLVDLIRKAQTSEDIIKIMDKYGIKDDNKKIAQAELDKQNKLEALENLRVESDALNNSIHYLANQSIDTTMLLEILRTFINEINRLSFEISGGV